MEKIKKLLFGKNVKFLGIGATVLIILFVIIKTTFINNKQLVSINFKIENEILIVDFLDKIYKNVSFATNDIKNLAELIRLETQ